MKEHSKVPGIYIPTTIREWLRLYSLSHEQHYRYLEVNVLDFILSGAIDDDSVDVIIFRNGGNTVFDLWFGDNIASFVEHLRKEYRMSLVHAYRLGGETVVKEYAVVSTADNKGYLVRVGEDRLINVRQPEEFK